MKRTGSRRLKKKSLLIDGLCFPYKKQEKMDNRKKIKDKAYKHFLKLLEDGDTSIGEILNGYIEMREWLELAMNGASEAIEAYKSKE